MFVSGDNVDPAEKPVHPVSFSARTTNSTGQEYRVKKHEKLLNSVDRNSVRSTGAMAVSFPRYSAASASMKRGSGGFVSLTKNSYSLVTSRRAVSGWLARAAIRSR